MKTFLCGFLVLTGTCLFAQNSRARFIELSGAVETRAEGSTEWVPAAPGMEIGKDAVVSTGFNGTAPIGLGNSVLMIRPLTRLTVAEIAQRGNDEEVGLYLETGRVLFANASGQAVYVDGGERSYVDEAQNRVTPPFEAETASLTPVLPELSDTGNDTRAGTPVISRPSTADVGATFEWP